MRVSDHRERRALMFARSGLRRMVLPTALMGLLVLPTGCVQQSRYDRLARLNHELELQIERLSHDIRTTQQINQDLRHRLETTQLELEQAREQADSLNQDVAAISADHDELLRRIRDLAEWMWTTGRWRPATVSADVP